MNLRDDNIRCNWIGFGRKRPHQQIPHFDPLLPAIEPPIHEPWTETKECSYCGSDHGCDCQEQLNNEMRAGW